MICWKSTGMDGSHRVEHLYKILPTNPAKDKKNPGTFCRVQRLIVREYDKGVEMKTKHVLIAAILVLATLLSACGPTTIQASAQPPVRTLNVSGTGKVDLAPDIAYINLGVHTENPSAADAVASNNAQTEKVIDALKGMGIAEKDIRTTNFSIWPSQNYSPDGTPLDTKYVVDNTVFVTIRDLSKLGDLLDSVIAAGVNTVNSVRSRMRRSRPKSWLPPPVSRSVKCTRSVSPRASRPSLSTARAAAVGMLLRRRSPCRSSPVS
jgi:hypothetical protein